MPETARTATAARPATASAWLVVLVISAIAAVVIVTAAFSGNNTRSSIDGTTATTSHLVDGP